MIVAVVMMPVASDFKRWSSAKEVEEEQISSPCLFLILSFVLILDLVAAFKWLSVRTGAVGSGEREREREVHKK